ncbi:MAG: hypothetical protein AAF518_26355 [Spirochaetota bacterium]
MNLFGYWFRFKKILFLSLFLYPAAFVYGESYSFNQFDDRFYAQGGAIAPGVSRTWNIFTFPIPVGKSLSSYAFTPFVHTNFFSMRGGRAEEKARKYGVRGAAGGEISDSYEINQHWGVMLLVSASAAYEEFYQLQKVTEQGLAGEALTSLFYHNSYLFTSLEGGRGFQRLDSYGLVYNAYSYYIEYSILFKRLHLRLNLQLIYPEKSQFVTGRAREVGQGEFLSGGSVSFWDFPGFQYLQLFAYTLAEKLRIARREFGFATDSTFSPRGRFLYRGMEGKTKYWRKLLSLEFAGFTISGKRYRKEYDWQIFAGEDSTNAYIAYLVSDFKIGESNLRLGGLQASKDRTQGTDRENNGYQAIQAEARIFGGRSSFFLQHSLEDPAYSTFQDFGETERTYRSRGLELASAGFYYPIQRQWQVSLLANFGNCFQGKGGEAILSLYYQDIRLGFLTASVTKAYLKNHTPESFIWQEWQLKPKYREFTRFYLSAGLTF